MWEMESLGKREGGTSATVDRAVNGPFSSLLGQRCGQCPRSKPASLPLECVQAESQCECHTSLPAPRKYLLIH